MACPSDLLFVHVSSTGAPTASTTETTTLPKKKARVFLPPIAFESRRSEKVFLSRKNGKEKNDWIKLGFFDFP